MDIRLLSVSVDRQAGENLGEKWNAKRFRYLGDTIKIMRHLLFRNTSFNKRCIQIRLQHRKGIRIIFFQKIRISFFTGFDDFEYAKEAVHLEIEEYILKPLNAVEITEVFKRLKEKLDYEISEKRNTDLLKKYYAASPLPEYVLQ